MKNREPDDHLVPGVIGHFRVQEKLGEGGMGTVYVGLDETLDRRVALKLIRVDHRLDPARKARLLREARILSQLNHPGVCQLYDFIEHSDGDCLVLELVDGHSLRQAMEEGIGRERSMRIAAQLLDVLAAVHGKGVVHRDLKPENVMLATDDRVKVLDFGVAREHRVEGARPDGGEDPESRSEDSSDEPSESHPLTTMGTIIGTVGYMSPEQARGERATAASDMYSLGLILQEMLTGRCPIRMDLPQAVRLRRAMWGESDPVVGLPPDLTQLVERLKHLEPAARPAAVDAAELLQRVRDRPRRRRFQAGVAAAVVLLSLFGAGMTVQFFRAERERERAEQQRTRAEREAEVAKQISKFLQGVFEVSDPSESRGNSVTARELIDRAAERVDFELAQQPLLKARMMATMGDVYRALGLYDDAAPLVGGAMRLRQENLEGDHEDLASSLNSQATLNQYVGELDAAESTFRQSLAMIRRLHDGDSAELAQSLNNLGLLLSQKGGYDEAEAMYREALEILRRLHPDGNQNLATTLDNLAGIQASRRRIDDAEELMREALAMRLKVLGEEHPDVASGLNNLASVRRQKHDYEEAERLSRRALSLRRNLYGDDHPLVAGSLNNLAYILEEKGELDEAESTYLEALAMRRRLLGDAHPDVATTLNNLAFLYGEKGDLEAAEAMTRESLEIRRQVYGDDHPRVARAMSNLAILVKKRGDVDEAERLFRESLRIRRQVYGDEDPGVAVSLHNIGWVLQSKGDYDQAEEVLREALAIRRRLLGEEHPDVGRNLRILASVARDRGDFQSAEQLYREALSVYERSLPPDHRYPKRARAELDSMLQELGRVEDADEDGD